MSNVLIHLKGICRKCRGILKPMVESKHDGSRSGIKEDEITEQMRDLEMVRYTLIFLLQGRRGII